MVQPIPSPLVTVGVPAYFSPSLLPYWGGCAAKLALGSTAQWDGLPQLSAGPSAAVGSLIHRVLERWSRDPEAVNPGSIFDAEYLSLSEKLARDPDRQHFADLVQT